MIEDNNSFLILATRLPHLGDAIKSLWGDSDFSEFIQELLAPCPDGHGLSSHIRCALQELVLEHDLEFPKFVKTDNDI